MSDTTDNTNLNSNDMDVIIPDFSLIDYTKTDITDIDLESFYILPDKTYVFPNYHDISDLFPKKEPCFIRLWPGQYKIRRISEENNEKKIN